MFLIFDLHCDLLSYLSQAFHRSVCDSKSHCSLAQMQSGNVKLQTLAIFSETKKNSIQEGNRQVEQFLLLLKNSEHFTRFKLPFEKTSLIQIAPAFENASAFSSEEEPLKHSIARLEEYIYKIGAPLYISLTWNGENRFGGGCGSSSGLKSDGKSLIEWMHLKNIGLDLSHASDRLAEEVINHLDAYSLQVPLLASHSNFRTITSVERNLPDLIAKEIIRRKGLIGLNLFRPFIHLKDPLALIRHVEYALDLGAHENLCFGADFFCDSDFPDLIHKYHTSSAFFPEYADASKYPAILQQLKIALNLSDDQLIKIAHQNALKFLNFSSF